MTYRNSFKHSNSNSSGKNVVKPVPILTAISFPPLSETMSITNNSDKTDSYLSKVKKVNLLEKDAVLPGFVQINFDKCNNTMKYTYGATKPMRIIEEIDENEYAIAAFNALNSLYEKRKASYIKTWGIDTYESVFVNNEIYEDE
jgi:hypothetical protein